MNVFNDDFKDFISKLNQCNVEYILVGGYAVILHGYHRTTGGLDIWINPTESNYERMIIAFSKFGLPTNAISKSDFMNNEEQDVFTFGRPPVCIDIMTKVKGLHFSETFNKSSLVKHEGIDIRLIQYQSLISAKKSSGRFKDLNDIEHLEQE